MKNIGRRKAWIAIALIPLLIGCVDDPDQRLANMAERNLTVQARQNEQMAQHSQAVVEASRDLVAADAQARKEMVAAHADLQSSIQADRTAIEMQREALEQERREIALNRYRDPLVAQAITAFGFTLPCILPLALAAYAMYVTNRSQADEASLNEILISEIVSVNPLLLPAPPPTTHMLEQSGSTRASANDA